MTATTAPPRPSGPPAAPERPRSTRRKRARTALVAHGEPAVWLMGGGLVLALLMIAGLLWIVLARGLTTFWPTEVTSYRLVDGTEVLGELADQESFTPDEFALEALEPALRERALAEMEASGGTAERMLVRTGNYELTGEHFRWVSAFEVEGTELPEWAVVVERMTWGRFYGTPTSFEVDGEVVADTPEAAWRAFEEVHGPSRERFEERRALETHAVGEINRRLESGRLRLRSVELEDGRDSEAWLVEKARFDALSAESDEAFAKVQEEIAALKEENERFRLVLTTSDGQQKGLVPSEIVRAYPANQLDLGDEVGVYLSRWGEFLTAEPREANAEGGVLPAIFGTVVMTLVMSIVVVPFGVLAALYLREYAKQGWAISAVRVAVNNLAGVPSIVFGVFGLGFFCYLFGASLDQLFFTERLPSPTYGKGGLFWASLTLALLTLPVVIVATEEALAAVPNSMREGSYACGATKWQTIRRIVLPRAAPGIMTGTILAIARGAGEVAPLMLVGAVKVAAELPVDGIFPYVHPERSFMHLGFHIFDLGFQSQNSEAAKPMVFTTTLLLIGIVVGLNLLAVWVRARLRRRFHGHAI